ncbi:MAG: AbrB/MazE/SpoVT family DNA-binding domain-containing protein [Chloroflexia bacterium]|nr:AbrB/MazE/SpoVT family DNA-binding domain-containing protein [Chloroflexia bacterium]
MIQQQLRRSGNSLVVTIPKEEVERLGIREGQLVALEITPLETRPVLRSDVRKVLEESREEIMPALRYLAEH